MSNEEEYTVLYKFRRKPEIVAVKSLKAAFEFVDEMENGPGGYAEEISNATTRYRRLIDYYEGKAYWLNLGTGEKFEQYRG